MLFKSIFFKNKLCTATFTRGFGLVELMVSISIMTLVSTVILVKNRSFNNALLLRNQAYEVAFSLRQAQLLAVSGNRELVTESNQYGIHFDFGSSPGNRQYRLFRDDSNTGSNKGWYDTGDTVLGSPGFLDGRFIIDDVLDSNGNSLVGDTISITFERPNFDAILKRSATISVPGPVYIKIVPKDTTGYDTIPARVVEVTRTGQITVK